MYLPAKKVGTHRRVHAKHNIEGLAIEIESHIFVREATFGFVEDDKLDVRNVSQEPGLGLTDDPGYPGARPVVLKASHNSKCVTCVTDCGESNDTNVFGL